MVLGTKVGETVCITVGKIEGTPVVGEMVGRAEGFRDGTIVGAKEGFVVLVSTFTVTKPVHSEVPLQPCHIV
jgi:hypothetical protein